MREYLSKLKPKNINDLAAMNALYRPGPMKLIPDFIDKRVGKKKITYMHPKMESALKETYGIIVYQEQVMQIAREVAGFTMAQADNMRKAIGKKIKKSMEKVKEDFIKGAVKNGVAKRLAENIFALILDFADYGFNKSHGVAYSILAFYTAYLKTHYPLEFLAVSMEYRKDDETELQLLADECKNLNIKIRRPDVNDSGIYFEVIYTGETNTAGEILYGLSALKNVGEKAAEKIVTERKENGTYKNLVDFLIRVDLRLVNRKTIESLIFAGAFDGISPNRKMLIHNLERATMFAQRIKETPESKGQEGLFLSQPSFNEITNLKMIECDVYPEIEKYNLEKSIIGFYMTGHPLNRYRKNIEAFVNLSFGDDVSEIEFEKLGTAKMCGIISDMQIKSSKKGNKFAVFNLVDLYGSGECVAFSRLFEQKEYLFRNESIVFVEGKAEENGDKIKLLVENIYPIESYQQNNASNILLNIYENKTSVETLEAIQKLADENPGTCSLFFSVIRNGKFKVYRSKAHNVKPTLELISNLKQIVGEDNLTIN
ncbi:DNA polymerase III subunit alpha [bacterium]|nr:MAG: DNA polymerase III subunit alpha [bacterium]